MDTRDGDNQDTINCGPHTTRIVADEAHADAVVDHGSFTTPHTVVEWGDTVSECEWLVAEDGHRVSIGTP